MITSQQTRPLCANCRAMPSKPNGISKHGFTLWHKYCVTCAKAAYNSLFGYLLDKKTECERCGFVAEDKCQLDVVNKTTYCACCSRLLRKNKKKKSVLDITTDSDVGIS